MGQAENACERQRGRERATEIFKKWKKLLAKYTEYDYIYMTIEEIFVSVFKIILKLSHQDDQSIP